jgi:hypothetical protein
VVGIGHAGTFSGGIIVIPSAMENGTNRSAEAMTISYPSWFDS